MNTEEIRLVVDALRQLSGDASTAAIWWMVMRYGAELVVWLAGFGSVVGCVWMLVRAKVEGNRWADFGRKIAKAMGGRGDLDTFDRDQDIVWAKLAQAVMDKEKEA